MAQYALGKIAISIHAPTRGATLVELEKTMNEIISIHAPTRGATLCGNRISRLLLFQSTLLQEERHIPINSITRISINFNPRSYKRSDIFQLIP